MRTGQEALPVLVIACCFPKIRPLKIVSSSPFGHSALVSGQQVRGLFRTSEFDEKETKLHNISLGVALSINALVQRKMNIAFVGNTGHLVNLAGSEGLEGMKSATRLRISFRFTRWPAEGLQNEVHLLPEKLDEKAANYLFFAFRERPTLFTQEQAVSMGVKVKGQFKSGPHDFCIFNTMSVFRSTR